MTVSMMSPTGITHSIPRPKSPRRPDIKNAAGSRDRASGRSGARESRSRSTPFIAAEAFQKAYGTGHGPRIRRRSHQQIGHFPGTREGQDPPARSDPRVCVSGIGVNSIFGMNKNAAACVGKSVDLSKEYAVRYGPTARENIVTCSSATAQGMTEVAVVAADIYRQECKTNNRGDDSLFFVDAHDQKESNSMVDTVSTCSDEPCKTPSKEERNDSSKRKNSDDPDQTFRSPRSMRFPEAIILKDPATDVDISPPRVDRFDASKVWPEVLQEPQAPHGQEDHTNLREARLQLFKTDNADGAEQVARLARALEDLNRQDQLIGHLQRELKQSNEKLEVSNNELEEIRSVAQQRQFTATEIRARAVQERKKMEESLERETLKNEKLQTIISQLQVEASSLKMALRNATNDGTRKARQPEGTSGNENNSDSKLLFAEMLPTTDHPLDSALIPSVITMRAEIVDLRSQLAEAKAAKLEDKSALNLAAQLQQVQEDLEEAESELTELRGKQLDVGKLEDRHMQSESLLREKLEKLESSSKEAKLKLEAKLKDVIESENTIKAELIKTKASLHRLERERSQKKLKSASESDRLNKQLASATQEVEKLKKQLLDNQGAHKAEIQTLRTELSDLTQKLSQASQESLLKSTENIKERRKLQKDNAANSQEVKSLQEMIASKDNRIKNLESMLGDETKDRSSNIPGSSIQQLKDEIRLRKANEAALRAEIKIQKKLAQQAKAAEVDQDKSQRSHANEASYKREIEELKQKVATLQSTGGSNDVAAILAKAAVSETKLLWEIDELKKTISDLRDSKKSSLAADNAKEQAYLNDIFVLKASLSEAEDRCKEEKFRADEERRISRETDAKRVAEIERLRQEKDELFAMGARRLEEIDNLKRKIEAPQHLASERNPKPWSVPGKSSDDSSKCLKNAHSLELPENVLRLRKELALARARLAAAREDSRIIGFDSKSPSSPDKSTASGESSWAPPAIVRRITDLDGEKPLPVTSRKILQPFIAEESSKLDVSDLQRQLRESSQRLSEASSRLEGFVQTNDSAATGPAKASLLRTSRDPGGVLPGKEKLPDTTPVIGPVGSADNSSVTTGVIEEVTTCESGNIEVTERRFFDI